MKQKIFTTIYLNRALVNKRKVPQYIFKSPDGMCEVQSAMSCSDLKDLFQYMNIQFEKVMIEREVNEQKPDINGIIVTWLADDKIQIESPSTKEAARTMALLERYLGELGIRVNGTDVDVCSRTKCTLPQGTENLDT